MPEAGFAKSELAIGFHAVVAFLGKLFFPGVGGVGSGGSIRFFEKLREDVQVVNVAKQILDALELLAPDGIVIGEKAFDRVAEALDANAEGVPRLGFFGA